MVYLFGINFREVIDGIGNINGVIVNICLMGFVGNRIKMIIVWFIKLFGFIIFLCECMFLLYYIRTKRIFLFSFMIGWWEGSGFFCGVKGWDMLVVYVNSLFVLFKISWVNRN